MKRVCNNIYLSTFLGEGYCRFLDEVKIVFIDKTDPKDPNRREHYWRHTLKTMAPDGLVLMWKMTE